MTQFLLDVSKWQGHIDWPRVSAWRDPITKQAIAGVIIRASIARVGDARFVENVRGAQGAGIDVISAYHYIYPSAKPGGSPWVDARKQAAKFAAMVKATGLEPVRLWIDVEYRGVTRADAEAFEGEAKRLLPGFQFGYYGGEFGSLDDSVRAVDNPTWLAWYPGGIVAGSAPSLAYKRLGGDAARQWGVVLATVRPSLWQFTSTNLPVPGIPSRGLDWSAFRGTVAELRTLMGGPGAAPAPTPVPDLTPTPGPTPKPKPAPDPAFVTISRDDPSRDTIYDIWLHWGKRNGFSTWQRMCRAFPENTNWLKEYMHIPDGTKVRVR